MSLATDFRPYLFSEVVGQETAKEALKSLAKSEGIQAKSILLKGAYGCLHENTLINTELGIWTLKELSAFQDKELYIGVQTSQTKRYVDKVIYKGAAKTRILKFKSGRKIEATNDHRFYVLSKTDVDRGIVKEDGFFQVRDLEVGDKISCVGNTVFGFYHFDWFKEKFQEKPFWTVDRYISNYYDVLRVSDESTRRSFVSTLPEEFTILSPANASFLQVLLSSINLGWTYKNYIFKINECYSHYDEIEDIEESVAICMDLSICPEDPTYIVNGLYSHNSGKCVHPDTIIKTDEGLRKAKDIHVGESFSILDKPNRFVAIAENDDTVVYNIRTKSGRVLRITGNHPVLVGKDESDNEYLFKQAAELKPGDPLFIDTTFLPVPLLDSEYYLLGVLRSEKATYINNDFSLRLDYPIAESISKLLRAEGVEYKAEVFNSKIDLKLNVGKFLEKYSLSELRTFLSDFYELSWNKQFYYMLGYLTSSGVSWRNTSFKVKRNEEFERALLHFMSCNGMAFSRECNHIGGVTEFKLLPSYDKIPNTALDEVGEISVEDLSKTGNYVKNPKTVDLQCLEDRVFYTDGIITHNTTLTRIFAKAVNCETFKKTGEVCERGHECPACKEAMMPNSQHYYEFDSTRTGSVDDIRSLGSLFQTYVKGRRVVCLDEIHACFDYRTPILTVEGAKEIKRVVTDQSLNMVRSVDFTTGEVVEKRIVQKYDNGQDYKGEWFKLIWNGGSCRCTADHNFFQNGKKVQVKDLLTGDKIDSVDWVMSKDAEQVLIGTLLGDSIFNLNNKKILDSNRSRSQANVERIHAISMNQGTTQKDYLYWKASYFPFGRMYDPKGNRNIYRYNFYMRDAQKFFCLHSTKTSFKDVKTVIPLMGPLAYLVWYLDDGHYNKDNFIEIACTNLGEEGVNLFYEDMKRKGWEPRISKQDDKRSSKVQYKIRLTVEGTKKFFEYVKGLIDIDCINYKIPEEFRGKREVKPCEYKLKPCSAGIIKIPYTEEEWMRGGKRIDYKRRFNIEVEDTHNYLLPGGVVSANCSKQAQTALLKMLEEGVPNTFFVLATTDDVLETIESRSVLLDVTTIPLHLIEERVKQVAEASGIELSQAEAATIALKSRGHMRNALSILEAFSLAGPIALRTSLQLLKKFVLACLKKEPYEEILQQVMLYPLLDIRESVGVMLNDFYTSDGKFESLVRSKGIHSKLFQHFYSPVVREAMKDEWGMELSLRSLAEKFGV